MDALSTLPARVAVIRRFNRFYTQQIGVLREGLLNSPYSLTQVRVLYELAHREAPLASDIARDLGLDRGYLSRILRGFEKKGLLLRRRSKDDARQTFLSLTRKGHFVFRDLNMKQDAEVELMFSQLRPTSQKQAVAAMQTIEQAFTSSEPRQKDYILRSHRPGDMGWIIHRHGVLYSQEYGWDERFEALVAEIAAKFIQNLDPQRERCWLAEREGQIVGSIFLVKQSARIAKLRLLLVEPSARGQGIGRRLVDECIRFARQAGYRKITLWTQNNLHSARKIYQAAGFTLVHEEPNNDFGKGLKSQVWDLAL